MKDVKVELAPSKLKRSSDGELFSKNDNGSYSMDTSMMIPKYEWSLQPAPNGYKRIRGN